MQVQAFRRKMEISSHAIHPPAVNAGMVIIAVQKKVNFAARPRQHAAIEPSQRSGPNHAIANKINSDFHCPGYFEN